MRVQTKGQLNVNSDNPFEVNYGTVKSEDPNEWYIEWDNGGSGWVNKNHPNLEPLDNTVKIYQPNWKLLRAQKQTLLNTIAFMTRRTGKLAIQTIDDYQGLVNLIDNIQDSAVAQGVATELEVFGKTIEE